MIPDNTPDDRNPLLPESITEPLAPAASSETAPYLPVQTHLAPTFQRPAPDYSRYPEDLRVPWGWFELLLFVAISLIGTFLVSVILVAIFAIVGVSPGALQTSTSAKSLFLIVNQAVLSLGLLVFLSAQIRVRFRSPFWQTIGWRPLQTGAVPGRTVYLGLILGGFSLSLLVQLASAAFQNKAKLPIQDYFQDPRSALLLMIMSIVLAPLVEETIFRGYIYPVLARRFGIGASVVITGTLFGLLHAPQLWGGWGQILLLIGVGIIFTAARAVSHTVVASYLLHVSYNSFLFIAFLVATHGLRQFPAGP